ncbi:MAG: PAAR domain-containing protein [Phycisphaerales bacterium]
MGQPAARVGDMTGTGDAITGPGVATVLIGSQPASVMGDTVSGGVVIGVVAKGSATVLIQNRPAARIGDLASGVNPTSGAPATSTIAGPGSPTVLIGG